MLLFIGLVPVSHGESVELGIAATDFIISVDLIYELYPVSGRVFFTDELYES